MPKACTMCNVNTIWTGLVSRRSKKPLLVEVTKGDPMDSFVILFVDLDTSLSMSTYLYCVSKVLLIDFNSFINFLCM